MAKLQSSFSSKQNLCVLLKELCTKKVLYQCCKHCPFFSDLHFVTVWLRKKKDLGRNHHLPGITYSMSKSVRLMYYKERESKGD